MQRLYSCRNIGNLYFYELTPLHPRFTHATLAAMSNPSTGSGQSPPSGTVTLLFSDIEGSTKLAQAHPADWPLLRARHHAIVRAGAILSQPQYDV